MAIVAGDGTLLAAVIPANNVNTPPVGGSLANGVGSFLVFAGAGGGSGVSNMGGALTGNPDNFREMRPGTSGLFGKYVQLNNKGPAFRGVVILETQLELATTGGTGTLTECVLVLSSLGLKFISEVASVTEVSG